MASNRNWMYSRLINGLLNLEFLVGLEEFLEFKCSKPEWMEGNKIKCPCTLTKCQNRSYHQIDTIKYHLMKNGFILGYYVWARQGEMKPNSIQNSCDAQPTSESVENAYHSMVMDAAGPDFNPNEISDEPPNPKAQKFFDMLSAVNKELWTGCQNHLQLSLVARMLNMKAEHHMSQREFDDISQLIKEVVPDENLVTDNFYNAKRLVRGLGLLVEKIHCCYNGCMLFWGEDNDITICKICGHQRYKRPTQAETNPRRKKNVPYKKMYYFPLSPRLLRLYASKATANDMKWHAKHEVVEGEIQHCSDSIAWKHFNTVHPYFVVESRNVRLGLCIDGFQPFGQSGQQYSSWPVILTVYNLPPWLCMKETSMFLTVLVPGPRNPKHKLDVFFQPLIAELKELWDVGILVYDISTKQVKSGINVDHQ